MGLSCLGLSGFLGLGGYFLPHFREVFNYYLLKYFLMASLFVFFFWDYVLSVGAFNIVPDVSEVEDRISEVEDRMVEINEAERKKE